MKSQALDHSVLCGDFQKSFHAESRKNISEETAFDKNLRIVGNASGYRAHLDDVRIEVRLVLILPNTKSVLQPMRLGINVKPRVDFNWPASLQVCS